MIKHMVRLRERQDAFISIFSVMVIMAILTLVAVGFSNVTRKAQRRVLDNQLNTQAFYAAESGINDARSVIESTGVTSKTECQGPIPGFNYTLDNALNVGYTCVLINSTLPDIQFDSIPQAGSGSPKIVAFESDTNTAIKSFKVTWNATGALESTAGIPTPAGYPNILTTDPAWADNLGVLRIDLAPNNGSLDRATITDGSYTFFLYPSTNGAAGPYQVSSGIANQGALIQVNCPTNKAPCSAIINLSPGSNSKYVMRLQSIYNDVKAGISDVKDLAGSVSLQNAQTVVDVTGRASDIFRRIQVRLPLQQSGMLPAFAIQSADSICKRLLVGPTTTIDTSDITSDPDAAAACALETGGAAVPPPPPPACVPPACFPGDPRPFGKAYWGASIDANGNPSRHETPTGVSLSARRTYWQWDDAINAGNNMYNVIRSDLQSNRLPFISIKAPVIASGSSWDLVGNTSTYDAQLDGILTRLEAIGNTYNKPIWVVFHHEPEGGGASGNTPDDPGGPVAWRAMQRKVRARMDILKTKRLAFMPILMTYTWDNKSTRDPNDWWEPAARWDAFIVDHFQVKAKDNMFTDGTWVAFTNWINAKNMPFGTGEWGNTCKQFSCAATAAAGGVEAANEMQAYWDAGFPVNSRNVVIQSYFDSSLNSTSSPFNSWQLQGQPLLKFQDIMKNDPRVMRINQLP